jgi:hypothetical protein
LGSVTSVCYTTTIHFFCGGVISIGNGNQSEEGAILFFVDEVIILGTTRLGYKI